MNNTDMIHMAIFSLVVFCMVGNRVNVYGDQAVSPDQKVHWRSKTLDGVLAAPSDGMGMVSLKSRAQDMEFAHRPAKPTQALLWKIRLTDQLDKKSAFVTIDNTTPTESRSAKRNKNGLILTWNGVQLPDDKGTLDVMVRTGVDKDTGFTTWRINIKNHSDAYGIWRTIFPVIQLGKLGQTGLDDFLLLPTREGRSIRNPIGLKDPV